MNPTKNLKIWARYALVFLALTFASSSVAISQNMVQIFSDSTSFYGQACPTPVTQSLYVNGICSSYNAATDSMIITFLWGDGSSDLDTVPIYEAGTYDPFYANKPHVYALAGTYFPVVIATAPDNVADTLHMDSLYVSTGCVTISGYAYEDLNSNCNFDAGDDSLASIQVTVHDANGNLIGWDYTNWQTPTGYYEITLASGLSNLSLSAFDWSGKTVTCPSGGSYTINSNSNQSLDFGLECLNNMYDNRVYTGGYVAPPGDTGWLWVYTLSTHCSNVYGGQDTLIMTLDTNVQYIGTVDGQAPNVVSSNQLTWYFSYTGNNWYNADGVWPTMRIVTDTTVTVFNDTAYFTSSLTTPTADVNWSNNVSNLERAVGVSYDPNNKLAFPGGEGAAGYIDTATQTMTYQVNFQNTGTAPARNVYILDSIGDKFNLESMRIVTASHKMNFLYQGDRRVRFDFPDINLPDSVSDEEGSKGFVIFEIDLVEGLPIGTQLENTAGIYFDYNEPIITNTTLNTLYAPVVLPDSLMIQASASDVTCLHNDNGSVVVNIMSGNPPYTYSWSNGATNQTQTDLAPGTYGVTVTDNEQQTASASGTIEENRIHESPIVGEVIGPMSVQSWKSYTYHINVTGGSSFNWSVDGGEIINTTNNQVEVLWHAGPDGKLYVTEKDMNGCIGMDSTQVPILFVGIRESQELPVKAYPNPANDEVIIELPTAVDGASMMLMDLQGRMVMQQRLNASRTVVGLADVSEGVYLLKVSNDRQQTQIKLAIH